MKTKSGISLIVLVITIIIMIILAAAIMLTLSNTGIIGQAEKATNEYSKKDATTVLESALALLKKDKYTNKEITFNDAYIDSELKEQDMIANGNIVIVGPWMYVIDREKLVIVSGPEKANLNEDIKIEATTTDAEEKVTIGIKITYSGTLSAVKIKGPDVDESLTVPTAVDGVYELTKDVTSNGSYVITVIDEKQGSNLTTVVVDSYKNIVVTYEANGGIGNKIRKEYKDVFLSLDTTIEENTFTHSNKDTNFASWNTKADGTGDEYLPGDNITLTQNLTLYAQWAEKVYIVKNGVLIDKNYTWAANNTASYISQEDGYVEIGMHSAGKYSNGICWHIVSDFKPTKLVYSINNTSKFGYAPATMMWFGTIASKSVHGQSGYHGTDYTYGYYQFCGNDAGAFGQKNGTFGLTAVPESEWYFGFQLNWRSSGSDNGRVIRVYDLYFEKE